MAKFFLPRRFFATLRRGVIGKTDGWWKKKNLAVSDKSCIFALPFDGKGIITNINKR
jgi:hypothetical protein